MDRFVQIPCITRAELKQANAVRLWLRVLTIADLVEPAGRFIPDNMLSGDWQAGLDIHWPYQIKPPKRFWATFRHCIRQAFCTQTSPNQPPSAGMDLDTPLGLWHPVPRHTWFHVYWLEHHVYWCTETHIQRMIPSLRTGFYDFDAIVDTIPLNLFPIMFQIVGDSIWSRRR